MADRAGRPTFARAARIGARAAALALFPAVFAPSQALAEPPAPRVMSLNVCTDQLVLALAAPGQIVSLSAVSDEPGASFHHAKAAAYAKNRGLAEEVLAARPDVVVTGVYSLHNTTGLLRALGMAVEEFDYTQTLDTIPGDIRRIGAIIGRGARAEAIAARFEAELEAMRVDPGPDSPGIVAYGPNGVALGAGTLADSAIRAAGLRNLAAERGIVGMAPLPLEALLAARPEIVLINRPYAGAPSLAELIARHPAISRLEAIRRSDAIPAGALSCGGAFTLEAVRALKRLRDEALAARRTSG